MRPLFSFFVLLIAGLFGVLEAQPRALVTIPAHRFFVQRVAGDKLSVELIVPLGSSAHTYEPTPKQVIQASKADLWFTTGEAFEARALRALQSNNPQLQQIDLAKGLDLIQADHQHSCPHCKHSGYDLHFWLSPKLAQKQVDTIVAALQKRYPADAALFGKNGEEFKKELEALDKELQGMLGDGSVKRLIIVAHPAYGYMGPDYGIVQLSIEIEGKDPTPRQLTDLIVRARKAGVRFIVTEPQYPNKGAKLIAAQLGIPTVELDPYSEDYMNTMRKTARLFSEAPKIQ